MMMHCKVKRSKRPHLQNFPVLIITTQNHHPPSPPPHLRSHHHPNAIPRPPRPRAPPIPPPHPQNHNPRRLHMETTTARPRPQHGHQARPAARRRLLRPATGHPRGPDRRGPRPLAAPRADRRLLAVHPHRVLHLGPQRQRSPRFRGRRHRRDDRLVVVVPRAVDREFLARDGGDPDAPAGPDGRRGQARRDLVPA